MPVGAIVAVEEGSDTLLSVEAVSREMARAACTPRSS